MDDYDKIARQYARSSTKPDKQYSMLPTILKVASEAKTPDRIVDLGCGDGFFTFPIAHLFPHAKVFGIDNSNKQLELARKHPGAAAITFELADIFTDPLSPADLVVLTFITNAAENEEVLKNLFAKVFEALPENGMFILLVDNPEGIDNRRFGAQKTIQGDSLLIELFDRKAEQLLTLHGKYYPPKRIAGLLTEIGFTKVLFHPPIVSKEGIAAFEPGFWEGYLEHPELCYISCVK